MKQVNDARAGRDEAQAPAAGVARAGKQTAVQRRYQGVVQRRADASALPDNACFAQPVPVIVTASRLRVRSEPGTSGAETIIGRLPRGARVDAIGRSGDWLMLDYQGQTAFIHGGYTDPAPDAAPPVAAAGPAESPAAAAGAAPAAAAPAGGAEGQATASAAPVSDPASAIAGGIHDFLAWLRDLVAPSSETDTGRSEPAAGGQEASAGGAGGAGGPTGRAADAGQTAEAGQEQAGPQAAGDQAAPAATPGALIDAVLTVSDPDARIRAPGTFRTTGDAIPVGTRVRVVAAERTYVQVVTVGGGAFTATADDQIWTAQSNLTAGGADVGMGNERTRADAAAAAAEIASGLPTGRRPGTNPAQIKFAGHFQMMRDGISLHSGLINKLMRMAQWAIHNDMVTGDIRFGDGMRSPAMAHKNSVAWHIQYDAGYDAMRRVQALPGGRDRDGNVWYRDGWTLEQVRANAHSVKPGRAIAAAGYPFGDQRRAPNPVDGREGLPSMGVSRHCSGGAIDVTFPWRKAGVDAGTNQTDVWGWDNILAQFGLKRPLPQGHRFEEYWHIEETSMQLDPDAPPTEDGESRSPAP